MGRNVRNLTLSSLLAAVTAALSLVAVPLPYSPVPLTGQTFDVMLSGLALGPWWGALSMLVYLAIGCLGFPVFAGGGTGIGTLLGPTGGYLVGFVLGAWATGMSMRVATNRTEARGPGKGRRPQLRTYIIASVLGGVAVVHTVGAFWLARYSGRTVAEAFTLGSAPFLPGDLLKAVVACLVASRLEATGLRWSR